MTIEDRIKNISAISPETRIGYFGDYWTLEIRGYIDVNGDLVKMETERFDDGTLEGVIAMAENLFNVEQRGD